jgi:hypothetical protein
MPVTNPDSQVTGTAYQPDSELEDLLTALDSAHISTDSEQEIDLPGGLSARQIQVSGSFDGFEIEGAETFSPLGTFMSFEGYLGLTASLVLYFARTLGEPTQIYLDSAPPATVRRDQYEDITAEWYTPQAVEAGLPETRLEARSVRFDEQKINLGKVEEWAQMWLSKPSSKS